ncbi:DUF5686 and carboxypeptidase-like regulatory domain-containing protein [Hugenholtzia roseola]|uniref:DUF5686 and carboxypeptidase-like regulatory domain-containing protein n=1 Tax=Hugenholtzia roseola TaxID=1002 RepID=UPI001FE0C26D|nr:DUF5686 and carboxypeptidase-like regulatory domain-containing protein [Hugenholtzia roseola]
MFFSSQKMMLLYTIRSAARKWGYGVLGAKTTQFFLPSVFTALFLSAFFFLGFPTNLSAQKTLVMGKVTDAETGDGVPFASVYFDKTTIGTTTDFDGYFKIETDTPTDSLVASYIGYEMRKKPIEKGKTQTVDFQLGSTSEVLKEVVITLGKKENPAWRILRAVVANKKYNDKTRLLAYEFDTYSKIEVDVDNITDKFREKKLVKKITAVLDSIERIAGEDGKPILPIFISETVSKTYFRKNPEKRREDIIKTKLTGVGMEDGSTLSQLVGSSFQDYNFYENWITITDKDFVSPIAESWRIFYDYELKQENVLVDGFKCYLIEFRPKRPEDLAFQGQMWITDSTFALKRIDVTVGKTANLNFIEKIKIQQELVPVEKSELSKDEQQALLLADSLEKKEQLAAGTDSLQTEEIEDAIAEMEGYQKGARQAWLPSKTRILVDVGEINDNWAGMLIKSYVSAKNMVVNQPKPLKFYKQTIKVAEDALISTPDYWQQNRHDSLSQTEQNVYLMIDTLRNLPVVKSYIEIVSFIYNGYKDIGKIDVGSILSLVNYNNVEGTRFMLNLRTNDKFSGKFMIGGFAAYGLMDERWKYGGRFQYIAKKVPTWTVMGLSYKKDIEQVAIFNDNLSPADNPLFFAFARWGNIEKNRPFLHEEIKAFAQTDLLKGLTQKITFRQQNIQPLYAFEYYDLNNRDLRYNEFTTSELMFETRIAFQERFIIDGNDRISFGTGDYPVFKLRYHLGLPNFLNSSFGFHKFAAQVEQSFRLGAIGRTDYTLQAGYIPSTIPYPLLESHLGNETPFYNLLAFNLMNYFEFVSDKFVSLRLQHRFEGLFLNSVPLMRKLKWRNFVEGNFLYGSVSQANLDLIPLTDAQGNALPRFSSLGNKPYVELSYGIENIFRLVRIQAVHRLTYLDNPNASRFGVRASLVFRL